MGEGRAYLPQGSLLFQVSEVGKVVHLVEGKAFRLEEGRGMEACLDRRGLAYRLVHRMVAVAYLHYLSVFSFVTRCSVCGAYHPEGRRMVEECR